MPQPPSILCRMRQVRDAKLTMPKLILPSIQINMDAGQFPEPESMEYVI